MKYLKLFEEFKVDSDFSKYLNVGQDRPEFFHLQQKYNETGIEGMENHELNVDGLIYKLSSLNNDGHGVDVNDFEDIKLEIEHHLKKKLSKKDIDDLVGGEIKLINIPY